MSEKIWDLQPEGGGPPVQVVVGNPTEAIRNYPKRYTRRAPAEVVDPAPPAPAADLKPKDFA